MEGLNTSGEMEKFIICSEQQTALPGKFGNGRHCQMCFDHDSKYPSGEKNHSRRR